MTILVTGGAGYIGSHTIIELHKANHEVIVIDDLSNSSKESLKRVEKISGKQVKFYNFSVLNKDKLKEIFKTNKIDTVIHFAAFKAVGESVAFPLKYYHNNISGTVTLLEVMSEFNVKNIVFSSSATVYGDPVSVPIDESFALSVTNPYGRTKLMIEEILQDVHKADNSWNIVILRYFNPVGAHKSGRIGEDPNGIPNNLMPYISQVAVGKLKELAVFGDDYNTVDGTGVRDYIHVVDLAYGHVSALKKISDNSGLNIYNLGTGKGYSVLETLHAFEAACGKKLKYKVAPRRAGDIASCYALPDKAKRELDWQATRNMEEMCEDAWRWQTNNPEGYKSGK
ncbi:MAG: UDP-glucose 4-epimerase GalE [Spirochaetaceae bacterium]|nr:UDP-glucose 4-epimerase GalE [Spirochaetaceae bacterium]